MRHNCNKLKQKCLLKTIHSTLKHKCYHTLTEAELLEDARHWVDHWPGGVGHTNMLTSYLMADNYWNADAW